MEPATHFIHEVMTDMSSRNGQPRDDLRSTSPLQVTGGFHFSDVVAKHTGINPDLPEKLKQILLKEEKFIKLPNDLEKVKSYILERV